MGSDLKQTNWVLLNRAAGSPPLFLTHAIGGSPLPYMQLGSQLESTPLYGAFAPGFQEDEQPTPTIEALASLYNTQLRAMGYVGRCRIGGYCSGAIIALEMAQQLRRVGQPVAPLVLIEPSVEPYDLDPDAQAAGLSGIRSHLFEMAAERAARLLAEPAAPDRFALEDLLRRLRFPTELSRDPVGWRLVIVMSVNYRAWLNYHASPYEGPIMLVLAADPPDRHVAKRGVWDHIATGAVTTHLVPGDHQTILSPVNAHEIGRLID